MTLSQDLQIRLQEWRKKALDGTITNEELKEAISLMRQERVFAGERSAKKRAAKAKPEAIDSDAMLNELGGL